MRGYAQSSYQKHEVGISGGAGISTLYYGVQGGENPLRFGGQVGLDYTFYVSPRFGIGTGVEFSFLNNKVTLDDGVGMLSKMVCPDDCSSVSSYNNLRVYGFEEKQRTTILNIPIVLQYNQPVGRGNTNLYARAGVKIGLPIVRNSDVTMRRAQHSELTVFDFGDGDYSFDEYFDGFEGLGNRHNVKYSPRFQLKTSYTLTAEVGANFALSPGSASKFYVGAFLDYGLNNIKKNATRNLLIDESYRGDCSSSSGCYDLPGELPAGRSILELNKLTSKVRVFSTGIKVRFTFGGCKPAPVPVPMTVVKYVEVPAKEIPAEKPAPAPAPRTEEPKEEPKPALSYEETKFILTPIIFRDINRSTLSPENQILVSNVADILKDNTWLRLLIEGRTCDIGTNEAN